MNSSNSKEIRSINVRYACGVTTLDIKKSEINSNFPTLLVIMQSFCRLYQAIEMSSELKQIYKRVIISKAIQISFINLSYVLTTISKICVNN